MLMASTTTSKGIVMTTPLPVTREEVLAAALLAIAGKAGVSPDVEALAREALDTATQLFPPNHLGTRGFVKPDTSDAVLFYEQDFYVLSNFSAFAVTIFSRRFPTAEHAYHYAKFLGVDTAGAANARQAITTATSAHAAFTASRAFASEVRDDWLDVRDAAMREILTAKTRQHPYVREKLEATGHRRLIEDSWRDDYWGWGPDRKGLNRLGEIWEGVRHDLRAGLIPEAPAASSSSRDEMSVEAFAAASHHNTDAFVNAWLAGNDRDSEAFPEAMSWEDWKARFAAFVSGEAR